MDRGFHSGCNIKYLPIVSYDDMKNIFELDCDLQIVWNSYFYEYLLR